jgi:serine O-acetyltransferase
MFNYIRADIKRVLRYTDTMNSINVLYAFWINFGLRVLVIYRLGRWLSNNRKIWYFWPFTIPLYPAFWLLSIFARKAYGIDLDQSADIGPGLYINHFGGIEVRNCRIGSHCNIQQQVKLGTNKTSDKSLIIGQGVYIGAHSKIFSNVTVGDGATIGAGTLVSQNVPQRSLLLGNPSRITQTDYDNSSLI